MKSCLANTTIQDLLNPNIIESARVEFKPGWELPTQEQILHTICAFANDYSNLNGGYIVIGVEESNGTPILPPKGLPVASVDKIQQGLLQLCHKVHPLYLPLISPENLDGKLLLVVWAPASDSRPHQAPVSLSSKNTEHAYYVRIGSSTIRAKGELLTELHNQTAKIPFDDRMNRDFRIEDIKSTLVKEYLSNIHSNALQEPIDDPDIYRRLHLVRPLNGREAPRNVALMFFSENPEEAIPGAKIEVVHFVDETGGSVLEERHFRGPLDRQIRGCLDYLTSLSSQHLRKNDEKLETSGFVGFPLHSLKESIVNAVYHRGYESNEPIKVYLYPDRLEITSYPGPAAGLKREHFLPGARPPNVPARNRRIGEFLKELRLAEGRGTGVPTIFRAMKLNGSPEPKFDFDDDRTYFTVTLPAHPEYVALVALRESAQLEATGYTDKALSRLEAAHNALPGAGSIVTALIQHLCKREKFRQARSVYERFRRTNPRSGEPRVIATLAECYLSAGLDREAQEVLADLASITSARDAIDLAILQRRARQEEKAHRLFQKAEGVDPNVMLEDPKALHEFAQCKIKLSRAAHRAKTKHGSEVNRKLLLEAGNLIQRVLQLDAHARRHAHAWADLAQVRFFLREPKDEINSALQKALELAPTDAELQVQVEWIQREMRGTKR